MFVWLVQFLSLYLVTVIVLHLLESYRIESIFGMLPNWHQLAPRALQHGNISNIHPWPSEPAALQGRSHGFGRDAHHLRSTLANPPRAGCPWHLHGIYISLYDMSYIFTNTHTQKHMCQYMYTDCPYNIMYHICIWCLYITRCLHLLFIYDI